MEEQVTITSRSRSKKEIARISISAICLALAVIINIICRSIPGLSFPNGGSVSLVYVPLCVGALFCGPVWGLGIGCIYGLLDLLIDGGFAINWISILCDYVFSYAGVLFAGLFAQQFLKKKFYTIPVSLLCIGIFRLFATFISGCTIWSQASIEAGTLVVDFSAGAIAYSLSYNAGYILPGVALSLGIIVLLTKSLFRLTSFPFIKVLKKDSDEEESKERISTIDLIPVYFIALFLLAIFSSIPQLQVYFLGYISLIAGGVLLGYSIYKGYQAYKGDVGFEEGDYLSFFKKEKYFYLTSCICFLVVIGISILAICSYYTYGQAYYL